MVFGKRYNARTKAYDKRYQCVVCRVLNWATGRKEDHDIWEAGAFVCSFRCQRRLDEAASDTVG